MEIKVDSDVQMVLEFMQTNIPASKLLSVVDSLSQIARPLWARYPQEPFVGMALTAMPLSHDPQRGAIVSDLAQ